MRLDSKTVRRCASAATPGGLSADTPAARPGLLDPHLPYLHKRWEEGCRSTDWLRKAAARPARPPSPVPKKVASWILTL